MAFKIKQNGVVKDLVIPACEVQVLDMGENFEGNNVEDILHEIGEGETVFVSDNEPDKDGIWISSDNSSVAQENPTLVSLKEYVNKIIGELSELKTNIKTNLVNAINELKGNIDGLSSDVSKLSNPNLLINSSFNINQRANSSYTVTGGSFYSLDRWISYNLSSDTTSVLPQDEGVIVKSTSGGTGRMRQWVELNRKSSYIGKTITFSIKVHNNCSQCALTIMNKDNSIIITKSFTNILAGDILSISVVVPSNVTDILGVQFSTTDSSGIYVKWAKLELGDKTTPYIPKDYAEELALCQRYYQTLRFGWVAWNTTTLWCTGGTYLCQMRITPTIKANMSYVDHFGGGNVTLSGEFEFHGQNEYSAFYLVNSLQEFVVGDKYTFFTTLDSEIY